MHSWESFLQTYPLKVLVFVFLRTTSNALSSYCYRSNSFRSSIFLRNRGKFCELCMKIKPNHYSSSVTVQQVTREQSLCVLILGNRRIHYNRQNCGIWRRDYGTELISPIWGNFFCKSFFFLSLFKWNSAVQLRQV